MDNSELKEVMEEIFKLLREKIITVLGDNITEDEKQMLYSFDLVKNIVVEELSKPVLYDQDQNKIIISSSFLNDEYIEKLKLRNTNFNIDDLKEKLDKNSNDILLEELIIFSKELNIQDKDIIKSLYIQEILKMFLMDNSLNIKNQVVREGLIELLAHEIGTELGFIVSTPKSLKDNLLVAELLKSELKEDFLKLMINKNIDEILKNIDNPKLLKMLEELANDREILESTQDLDEVVDTINDMNGVSQVSVIEIDGKHIIKFESDLGRPSMYETRNRRQFMNIYNELKKEKAEGKLITKEELERALDLYSSEIPLYRPYEIKNDNLTSEEQSEMAVVQDETKYEDAKMYVNPEEGLYIKESIIKIDTNEENGDMELDKKEEVPFTREPEEIKKEVEETKPEIKDIEALNEEEFNELMGRFQRNECTYDEMILMQNYIDTHEQSKGKPRTLTNKNGKTNILTIVIIITLTVAVGITLGWLLFKLK